MKVGQRRCHPRPLPPPPMKWGSAAVTSLVSLQSVVVDRVSIQGA